MATTTTLESQLQEMIERFASAAARTATTAWEATLQEAEEASSEEVVEAPPATVGGKKGKR